MVRGTLKRCRLQVKTCRFLLKQGTMNLLRLMFYLIGGADTAPTLKKNILLLAETTSLLSIVVSSVANSTQYVSNSHNVANALSVGDCFK